MTDLETACRELVESWKEEEPSNEFKAAIWRKNNRGKLECADELETALKEHTDLDPDVKHLVEQMEDAT